MLDFILINGGINKRTTTGGNNTNSNNIILYQYSINNKERYKSIQN